jgi:hypothetical protein
VTNVQCCSTVEAVVTFSPGRRNEEPLQQDGGCSGADGSSASTSFESRIMHLKKRSASFVPCQAAVSSRTLDD